MPARRPSQDAGGGGGGPSSLRPPAGPGSHGTGVAVARRWTDAAGATPPPPQTRAGRTADAGTRAGSGGWIARRLRVGGKATRTRGAGARRGQLVASAGEEARTRPGGEGGGAVARGRGRRGQGRGDGRGWETARLRSGDSDGAAATGTSGRRAPLAPSAARRRGRHSRRASLAPAGSGTQTACSLCSLGTAATWTAQPPTRFPGSGGSSGNWNGSLCSDGSGGATATGTARTGHSLCSLTEEATGTARMPTFPCSGCSRWADVSGQYLNSLFRRFAISFGRDPLVSSLTIPQQFHHNNP